MVLATNETVGGGPPAAVSVYLKRSPMFVAAVSGLVMLGAVGWTLMVSVSLSSGVWPFAAWICSVTGPGLANVPEIVGPLALSSGGRFENEMMGLGRPEAVAV